MSTGWIKLHRRIQDSDTFSRLTLIQQVVAIYLILNANHKDGVWYDKIKGEKVEVKRGQLITSRNKMYTEWFKKDKDISEQKIRTALDKLDRLGFLTKQSTKGYTIITVLNYNVYQAKKDDDNQPSNQAITKQQPSDNQAITTNKNVKNVKNKNTTSNQDSIESDFEKLWKLYPNKKGKATALKSYKRAIKKGATNKQIQDGIVAYKKHIVEKGIEQDYQKHGSTFFNQESWNDTYSTEQQNTGSSSSIPYLDEKGVYE